MASGHVNRTQRPNNMAAPTNAARVKKVLANSEPSTHGPESVDGAEAARCRPMGVKRTCRGHRKSDANDHKATSAEQIAIRRAQLGKAEHPSSRPCVAVSCKGMLISTALHEPAFSKWPLVQAHSCDCLGLLVVKI